MTDELDLETVPSEDHPAVLRIRYGPDWRNHLVPHPDEFDVESGIGDLAPGAGHDTPPEGRGPNSDALLFRISSSCSGHGRPPSPEELYRAFHTTEPTPRTEALVRMWMNEASENEFMDAWIDHCYTWREIAAACHRHGIKHGINARALNMMSGRRNGRAGNRQ